MDIKSHGTWQVYQPATPPEGAPRNAMFARRAGDGVDWYDYVNSGKNFASDSIKLTVRDGAVGAATFDPTALFPGGSAVLEVRGVATADPQRMFGKKLYDGKTFKDPPPSDFGPSIPELLARIDALEKKKGPD